MTQARFAELPENKYYSSAEDGQKPFLSIAQVALDGLNRVDRCKTCHLGIDDNKFAHAKAPFATHPGNMLEIHKEKDFGCTACHLGQGYAVSYEKAAHKKLPYWNETMLPRQLLQASCGTCHLSEEVTGAGVLSEGRLLITNKGCSGCHDMNDLFEQEPRGPDLAGLGNKVRRGWLYRWLKNPRDYLKNSRMPTFRLQEDEILSLVEFLLSLASRNDPPHKINTLPTAAGDEDRGRTLVAESRCITCHSINGKGGKLAPELERVGDKVREDWVANFLRNVHYYQPEKIMLEYNFTDQDALDIAAHILEEFTEEEYLLPTDDVKTFPQSSAKQKQRIEEGKLLFSKYGCDGCHNIDGKRLSPKVGPKLTNIGNRLETTLDFGKIEGIFPTLYNWLFLKVKQPEIFDSTSIMPTFFLSDREAFAIVVALLANREYGYAEEYLVRESERSLYRKPAGEFGHLFEKYSCISCHSIDKYGGTISTVPLTIEGSKVKFDWLKNYLLNPYAIRPIVTERMPKFRMTEREASLMADHITKVYVDDNIPRFFDYNLKPGDTRIGKNLLDSLECVGCHIINGKGGYVGPQLDDIGERLESGWMFVWLHDPLKYRPETIHPDYGLSEEQARQLTAYLATKKQGGK